MNDDRFNKCIKLSLINNIYKFVFTRIVKFLLKNNDLN